MDGMILYSYSKPCQHEKHWNEWTLQARGLVTDLEGNVIARPFPKFFNIEELPEMGLKLPSWPPSSIQDKADGSLIICFWHGGRWHFCTRGSFMSFQAMDAEKLGMERMMRSTFYSNLPHQCYTHLFELVGPSNRIVLDYDKDDLVYLASIHTDTGQEVRSSMLGRDFTAPKSFSAADLDSLYKEDQHNREGYVLTWPDGFKCKVKFEEYKRLHRLLSGMTSLHVWEVLSEEGEDGIRKISASVPEEWQDWLERQRENLCGKWRKLDMAVESEFSHILRSFEPKDRKEFAVRVKESGFQIPGALFLRYDDKDYSKMIWKHIRPNTTPCTFPIGVV
jgi:RNA ligase